MAEKSYFYIIIINNFLFMAKKAKYPNIVRGGIAIPIPNRANYYYMKGKKHKDGGIDIGENPRTGLEVEDGEVLHLTDNNIKVYSSVPFLNGKSPAEKVMGGENPNKVFKQQEDFKDRNNLNDDGTRKAEYGKKAAVVRTPEDEKVSKLTRSYYKEVNPLAGYPGVWDALAHGMNAFGRRYKDTDSTAYPVTDKVADATWRKRLGLSYDEADLPSNVDGSVRLPKDRELEIPVDTNLLKRRINVNLKLSDKYKKQGNSIKQEVVDWAIGEDEAALNALRKTYKTGEPVVVNEQAYNSRSLINNGEISMPGSSPLNPLQNYTLQYDKDKNVMRYRDVYDFNKFDMFVPGKGYEIKGEIDLNKKAMGGDNKIDPRHAKLIARRGMPGDIEALRAAGYDKYGNSLVTFNGGKFGGSGAGMEFNAGPLNKENSDYVRNTPILRSFSDAFAEAKRNGNSTFIFNGKKYTTKVSDNPNYIGKRYEPTLNIREVLDENKKVISDSTRVEPYIGQIPGTHKRIKKAMGGTTNKPVTVTVNGKTKVVYSPSTGGTRSGAEGNRTKAKLGLIEKIKNNKEDFGDIINLTGNIIGSTLAYNTNRRALNNMSAPVAPTPRQATKLKTKININPQLDKMRETLAAYERNVDANTTSSRVALARKNRASADMLSQYNSLLGDKENKETTLINQDRLNRQNITNQNIEDYSSYLDRKTAFNNALIEKKSENKVGLINNLTSSINNTITTRDKRRRDRNNLISVIAAHPNVNPQMLKDLGFDGITQEMIDKINKNR